VTTETKVVPSEFNNKPMFSIFKFKDGKQSEKPAISMGITKAKALVNHLEELKTYVEENTEE